jgi:hypothetical protein
MGLKLSHFATTSLLWQPTAAKNPSASVLLSGNLQSVRRQYM